MQNNRKSAPSQTKRARQTDPIQVIIKTVVLPGQSGTADLAWGFNDGSTDSETVYRTFDDSDKSITISDTHSNNCLLPGELAWVRYDEDAGSFVPIGSTGLVREACSIEKSTDNYAKFEFEQIDQEVTVKSFYPVSKGRVQIIAYLQGTQSVEGSDNRIGHWQVISTDGLVKFRLSEDLELCGTAQATLVDDECGELQEITVKDTTGQAYVYESGGRDFSQSGSMGFARFSKRCDPEGSESESEELPILPDVYEVVSIGAVSCCESSNSSDKSSSDLSSEGSSSDESSNPSSDESSDRSSEDSSSDESSDLSSDESSDISSEDSSSDESSDLSSDESSDPSSEDSSNEPSEDSNGSNDSSDSSSDDGCENDQFSVCVVREDSTLTDVSIAFELDTVLFDFSGETVTGKIWKIIVSDNDSNSTYEFLTEIRCDNRKCNTLDIPGSDFSPVLSSSENVKLSFGNNDCCVEGSLSSESSDASSSESSEGCFQPFDTDSLPIWEAQESDMVPVFRNGCMGLVPLTECLELLSSSEGQ